MKQNTHFSVEWTNFLCVNLAVLSLHWTIETDNFRKNDIICMHIYLNYIIKKQNKTLFKTTDMHLVESEHNLQASL